MLNRVGVSTLPGGRSFSFAFSICLRLFCCSTYNLLLDNKFAVLSGVVEFRIRSLWSTVSYVAERSADITVIAVIYKGPGCLRQKSLTQNIYSLLKLLYVHYSRTLH